MIRRTLFPVLLCLLGGVAQAQVNSLPSQPHLLVKGEATRTVRPDRFTISIQLKAIDVSAEVARQQVVEDASKVLDTFRGNGAREGDIEASGLSMQPEYQYDNARQVFKGTLVQRRLSATFDSLDAVRACLAALETSDNLAISGIQTAYADEAKLRGQLKKEAAEQTRESAQQLANAYGTRIIGLYTISDVAPQFAYGIQAGTWPKRETLMAAPPEPPAPQADTGARVEELEAGDIVISENVYAVFLISP